MLTIAQACWCFLETAVQTPGIQCFTRILLGALKLATGRNSVPQGSWWFRHRAAGEYRQQDLSVCLSQSPLHLDQPKEATEEQNENSREDANTGSDLDHSIIHAARIYFLLEGVEVEAWA